MATAAINAFWDGLTVNFADVGEKDLVVAAIVAKVKLVIDNISDFTTDVDETLNLPIYKNSTIVPRVFRRPSN